MRDRTDSLPPISSEGSEPCLERIGRPTSRSATLADSLVHYDYPLRAIHLLTNAALNRLSADFAAIYSKEDRALIPPERLLRALLQALFSVRSERRFMELISNNMLFRWFIGLSVDAAVGTRRSSSTTATGCWQGTSTVAFCRRAGPPGDHAAPLQRTLVGGRDSDRSVSLHEELPPRRRQR